MPLASSMNLMTCLKIFPLIVMIFENVMVTLEIEILSFCPEQYT
jgi:hypothetical protein